MITVNTPAGPQPATLYVMNDNLTFYFALLQSDASKANQDLLAGKNKQASNDFADFIKDVTKIMGKGGLATQLGQPMINAASSAMSQL